MLDIIARNVEDLMQQPLRGYFFKTLGQLLEHIYIADSIWLKAFTTVDSYGIDVEKEMGPTPNYGDKVFKNFEDYRSAREKLDTLIMEYMSKVEDDFLLKNDIAGRGRGAHEPYTPLFHQRIATAQDAPIKNKNKMGLSKSADNPSLLEQHATPAEVGTQKI